MNRAWLVAGVFAACSGVAATAVASTGGDPPIGGPASAAVTAERVSPPISQEAEEAVRLCLVGVPVDIVEQAHAATNPTLFSAQIAPCIDAAVLVQNDMEAGASGAEPLRAALGDWLRTLMALDDLYDTERSELDAAAFARLDESLAALIAVVG